MKTPLIFKLLLMIAVGLRLMKASKKTPEVKDVESYLDLSGLPSESLIFDREDQFNAIEQIKKLYRSSVRSTSETERTKQMWMVAISHSVIHTFKKGNIFRFIWHKNEWVLAFYQILNYIQMNQEAASFGQVIYEHSGNQLTSEVNDYFPDASIDSPALKEFNKIFDLEVYAQKVLQTISKS